MVACLRWHVLLFIACAMCASGRRGGFEFIDTGKSDVASREEVAPHGTTEGWRTVAGWSNHLAAFLDADVPKILEDYTDTSVLRIHDISNDGGYEEYIGRDRISTFFTNLFTFLGNKASDLPDLHANVVVEHHPGMVFLIWDTLSANIKHATDTFVFDSQGKIIQQNIVVEYVAGKSPVATGLVSSNPPVYKDMNSVSKAAWDNHFGAFAAQNIEDMMKDYDDNSVLRFFNTNEAIAAGAVVEYKGTERIRAFFTQLFADIWTADTLKIPVLRGEKDMIYLGWAIPAVGYRWATDSFVFKGDKIAWQNIVADFTPVAQHTPSL